MTYPHNAKLYRTTPDFTLAQYTYKRKTDDRHILEDENRVTVKVTDHQLGSYNMSRRMALTELEEVLRQKIERVHSELRQAGEQYNPLDTGYIVSIQGSVNMKEVHRYCKKSGRHLESYPAVRVAAKNFGNGISSNANISRACTGGCISAYGFKWSYEKRNFY